MINTTIKTKDKKLIENRNGLTVLFPFLALILTNMPCMYVAGIKDSYYLYVPRIKG